MKRKIIIGFDPQRESPDALQLGRVLSELLAATPVVVAALPWPTYLTLTEDLSGQIENEMREPFALIADEMRDLDVETRAVASRSPAATLQAEAENEGASLIVVSSCHHGPIGRTLAGSVGESLLHGSPWAIAIAPRDYARWDESMLKIAVAFDGSPEAWTAFETSAGICRRFHAELTVIAVADYAHYGYATSWSILTEGELQDAEREQNQGLAELAAKRVPYGTPVETRVETGRSGSVLAEISGEYDLMIAGSRGYGPLRRTLLGSTTRSLIHSSSCPVLVLPRGAGTDPLDLRGITKQEASPTSRS